MFHRDRQTGQLPAGLLTGGFPEVALPGVSAELGAPLQSGFGISRQASLIKVQGQDEAATTATVALYVVPAGNIDPGKENESYPIVANVHFGVGGTSVDYDMDFIDGTIFTVPASNLTVTARLDTDADDALVKTVKVGAFVSYLPRGGHNRAPQRTLRAALLASGSVVLPLPRFAHSVSLLSSVVGSTFTLEQYRDAAATLLVSANTIPAAPPHYETPICNETRYLKITNLSSQNAMLMHAIFQLFG